VAAVSVGLVRGDLLIDLDYEEDSQAAVDANFVATGRGDLVEVQLTAEAGPFPGATLPRMQELALKGIRRLARLQEETLAPWLPLPW
jgi:ribonuclease PH